MRVERLVAGVALWCLCAALPARADVYSPVATELGDPDQVVAAMRAREARDLPVEALAAYVQGIEAWHAGQSEDAVARLTLAATLDPSFSEAHLALARVRLFRDPRAAFNDLVAAARSTVSSFTGQHLLVVNTGFGLLFLVSLLFLALAGMAAALHLPRFHHSAAEVLRVWFPGSLAGMAALLVLCVPLLWGVGLLPVALLFAGLLWPWMRRSERGWIAVTGSILVVAPFLLWATSPFVFGPLDPAEPSFLLSRASTAGHSGELAVALEEARATSPRDPDLCFALATLEKRGENYARAEALYHEALELGAREAAVQNNLGVIAFLRGDYNRALELLQRSVANDSERAASHFNLSQTYAKKLFFEKADHELLQANRLSINRVRAALRAADGDFRKTLMDEQLPASSVWRAAASGPRRMPALPAILAVLFPGSLWLFPFLGAGGFAFGLRLGRRLFRHLPGMACGNCGRPVCRRCLKRIHQAVYCSPCGDVLLKIQSTSYSKLVLDSQAKRKRRLATVASRAADLAVPGLQAARRGRTTLAALLVVGTLAPALWLLHGTGPVTRLAWLDGMRAPWWPELPAAWLALVFGASAFAAAGLRRKPVKLRTRTVQEDPAWEDVPGEDAA